LFCVRGGPTQIHLAESDPRPSGGTDRVGDASRVVGVIGVQRSGVQELAAN
jgi:hypothetical protein